MSKFILFILYFSSFLFFGDVVVHAGDFSINNIPIQEGGRIKPLDTYARNQALAFYGKREIKHANLSAIDWILDLFIYPDKGLNQKIFNIRSLEVLDVLELKWTNNFHKYSYNEVSPGLQSQLPLIQSVFDKKEDERDAFEAQLIEVYQNVMKFRNIASSFRQS